MLLWFAARSEALPDPCHLEARPSNPGNFSKLTGSCARRLEHEIGMSVAPGDSAWRGRSFDAGLVLHRDTGSSRDCSAAWAADIVQRVSREGAAASDAASLAHVEGRGSQLS